MGGGVQPVCPALSRTTNSEGDEALVQLCPAASGRGKLVLPQGGCSASGWVLTPREGARPHGGVLGPQGRMLGLQDRVLVPQGGVLCPQGGVLGPQGGVLGPQSGVLGPQGGVLSP